MGPGALLLAAGLAAGEATYWFGTSEARTHVSFEAKTDVAAILGTTHRIEGSATIDGEAGTGKCRLRVPVGSLKTGVEGRDRVMLSEPWLDGARFPAIEFEGERGARAKGSTTWNVEGRLTLRGVSRDLAVAADVREIPEELAKKANLGAGRWVRARAEFRVPLSDFGIRIPERSIATVEDVWTVRVDLFGTTERPSAETASAPAEPGVEAGPVEAKAIALEGSAGTRYRFGVKPQFTSLEAGCETESGTFALSTSALSGAGVFDLGKGNGRLVLSVPTTSLRTGIAERDEELRRAGWFDAPAHPAIGFESTKVGRKEGTTWTVEGTLTIRGESRPISAAFDVREIPADRMKAAAWGNKGGLGLRGEFPLRLSDFGIPVPPALASRIRDEMRVRVDLVALKE
ncbi:MAG TPA: YceI family protein [Planctomycetota bacterium]|jgi:polyisoprenoid-binding protein YceI|nr:YceI family protein [Planctomycetota bacterium]